MGWICMWLGQRKITNKYRILVGNLMENRNFEDREGNWKRY